MFTLKHVALYAKCWYEKSDDVFEDLKNVLRGDDYTPDNKFHVFEIIVTDFAKYLSTAAQHTVRDILCDLSPSLCHRRGYYHKGHEWIKVGKNKEPLTNEYDYHEAVVRCYLSVLQGMSISVIGELPEPDANLLPVRREHAKPTETAF